MIDLPLCPPMAAAALDKLAPRLQTGFRFAGKVIRASLTPGQLPPSDWPVLGAQIAGHRAELRLSPSLLPQAAIAAWREADTVGLPDDLSAILREVLLAEIADGVASTSGARPIWLPRGETPPNSLRLFNHADGALLAVIYLDDGGLNWLAGRCAALPPRAVQPDWLILPLRLLLGSPRLSWAELCALVQGDVVLLDPSPHDAEGGLVLLLDAGTGPWLRGSMKRGQLNLLAELDGQMSEPETLPAQKLDDLPVRLDCELARLDIPLGRLRELAVGQVLDLGFDAANAVSLRVNGQLVAMAEMVRIADRVGLRITETKLARD
jgi:type III secretion protein Q